DGTIYVVEGVAKRIGRFSATGASRGTVGPRFVDPYDVQAAADGSLYVLETAALGTIKRVSPGGSVSVVRGGCALDSAPRGRDGDGADRQGSRARGRIRSAGREIGLRPARAGRARRGRSRAARAAVDGVAPRRGDPARAAQPHDRVHRRDR